MGTFFEATGMNEDRKNGIATDGRNPDGTFAVGNTGRPKGARHKTTLAIEKLLDGEAEALTRKAIELAKDGDMAALRLCLERIAPTRKDAPVRFHLPAISSAREAAEAASAVLLAVSEGDITPMEGAAVMALIEQYRRALEASDFEARISALEART
jgi:hypothetical protein